MQVQERRHLAEQQRRAGASAGRRPAPLRRHVKGARDNARAARLVREGLDTHFAGRIGDLAFELCWVLVYGVASLLQGKFLG